MPSETDARLLTVALPLFRSRRIAWLALESLARQEHPGCAWELIAAEEQDDKSLGEEILLDYYNERLAKVGCERVLYHKLDAWIPLGEKWRLLASLSWNTKAFLLQAADCYSNPQRLKRAREFFALGADWLESPVHVMYDLHTRRLLIYYSQAADKTGSDMALRTDLAKCLPGPGPRCSVDTWMRDCTRHLALASGAPFRHMVDNSGSWQRSLNVNGENHISDRRSIFVENPPSYFVLDKRPLSTFVPVDVAERLERLSAEFQWRAARCPELRRRGHAQSSNYNSGCGSERIL